MDAIHLIEKLDKRNRLVWLETIFLLQISDMESTIEGVADYTAGRLPDVVAHYRVIEECT